MQKRAIWLIGIALFITISLSFTMTDSKNQPTLHYLVRQPKVQTEKTPLVILLHGVGSNEANMFSLADKFPDNFKVISARGPLKLGEGSYAWFQVQFGSNGPVINAEQAENARKEIIKFIEDISIVEKFDPKQVYLVGFSQGGIMSYSVALTAPEKVKGIAVMSGRLLKEVRPKVVEEKRLQPLRIFISHGKQDPVLQYSYAEEAVAYLNSKKIHPDFHSYNEVHTINAKMIEDLAKWLKK
ncbi:alpha/beta fold hydrolase [Flavobacterium silvisoli]|uniref:Alpha/beta fold hydrolase n=1 Tax=Flavobacterium silvisoli TaxID=2529433 RepID=A0A4Q9Z1Y6_9FLAO|nr:alpha/beta fold hydrolase [Flavobacterium silvisoli]TBX70308.1 alpha/beta fold hydrolase [Flavobacterium silvisoli]